jgi:hypothetical protein
LASAEILTLLITEEPLFQVTITNPEKGLYFANVKVMSFFFPLIFGGIDVEAIVRDVNKSGVDQVEFYIDSELQGVDTTAPYSWHWSKRSFCAHMVKVIAYQNDRPVNDELKVWKIF